MGTKMVWVQRVPGQLVKQQKCVTPAGARGAPTRCGKQRRYLVIDKFLVFGWVIPDPGFEQDPPLASKGVGVLQKGVADNRLVLGANRSLTVLGCIAHNGLSQPRVRALERVVP